MTNHPFADEFCPDIHAAVADAARSSERVLAVWQTNGPRRPDVARDLTESCVKVLRGKM